jgi:hypothetical protein
VKKQNMAAQRDMLARILSCFLCTGSLCKEFRELGTRSSFIA